MFENKKITLSEETVGNWFETYVGQRPTVNYKTIVPGLCLWSHAHTDNGLVAANIDIRFSKPVYAGETVDIEYNQLTNDARYCKTEIKMTVANELRQQAILKCMPLGGDK